MTPSVQSSPSVPSSDQSLPLKKSFVEQHPQHSQHHLMETLQSLRQQVQNQAQDVQSRAQSTISQAQDWLNRNCQQCYSNMRELANRYPPVAAFLFTLIALSAIPVSIFAIFAVVSSAVVLTIALVGFSVVEGTMLAAGGGLLLLVLSGVGIFSVITFAFVSFVYVGYRAGYTIINQIWQKTNQMSGGQQSGIGGFNLPSVGQPSQQPSGLNPMAR